MPGPVSHGSTPSRWSEMSDPPARSEGTQLSDVQASVPYFRHVNDDDIRGASKHGYLHAAVSGPETPNLTVRPPRRGGVRGELRPQKSFEPSIGRQRAKGESNRRSWDGSFEPELKNQMEPRWVPGGAPPNAPGHEGRVSPQRSGGAKAVPLRTSAGWSKRERLYEEEDSEYREGMDTGHDESVEEQHDVVRTSYASAAPSEPPATQDTAPNARTLAADAAAMLEAARGARPREESADLENLDEEFYSRLSKLREDHQRNLNEISQLYESSVDATYEPQPQQHAHDDYDEQQAEAQMPMPPMMSESDAQGLAEDNRPWWQRDDKDYGEVLRRLKALDIPLPPGAGGRSQTHDKQESERDKRALYSWSADDGGGGGGDSPWGDRQKTRRPASAPRARRKDAGGADKDGWVGRATVPQPFKFDSRPKRPSIMAERTSFDLEVKRRLDEAECSTRFRAEPIPPTTMLPLYEKQEREKEAVRAKRVADRFQYLQETSDPPSCYYMKPAPSPTVEKPPPFKAKPVPPGTRRSLMQSFVVDDTMRKERVEARAQQLLREARLPSRQEAHQREVAEKEKTLLADPRAAELEDARRRMRERKIGVERFSYKPKITKKVPDYHTKQREFADKLKMRKEELKAQVEATAAKPFNIHESEPNLDRVHHDIMRDNSLLPENRWPYINSRLKGHAEPPPKMDPPKKTWKPTRAFTAREIEVKKKRLEQMVAARSQLNEAKARQEKQEEMNHMVSHALKDFEKERNIRIAEKKKEMQANADDKREKTKAYFKGLADMNRRVSRRKMLFEQATQDNLRRQVLEKFDETLVQEGVGYLAETD